MMFGLTGIYKYLAIGVAVLALVAVIVTGVVSCKKVDSTNRNQVVQSGIDHATVVSQGEVLNHVQKANDAVLAPSAQQLNVVCNKYDRNCAAANRK
jgi:hypothetical protein